MTADISIFRSLSSGQSVGKTCDADIARHVNRVMGNDHQAQQSAFPSIKNAEQFEDKFWSGTDLSQLYQK